MNRQKDKTNKIAILGAGLAGLAAGHRLNEINLNFNASVRTRKVPSLQRPWNVNFVQNMVLLDFEFSFA